MRRTLVAIAITNGERSGETHRYAYNSVRRKSCVFQRRSYSKDSKVHKQDTKLVRKIGLSLLIVTEPPMFRVEIGVENTNITTTPTFSPDASLYSASSCVEKSLLDSQSCV
jgi:hypothetical protein